MISLLYNRLIILLDDWYVCTSSAYDKNLLQYKTVKLNSLILLINHVEEVEITNSSYSHFNKFKLKSVKSTDRVYTCEFITSVNKNLLHVSSLFSDEDIRNIVENRHEIFKLI